MGSIRSALLLVLTACGGAAQPAVNVDTTTTPSATSTGPVPTVTPSHPEPKGDYATKLAAARKIRDEILASKPPTLSRPASKEKALRFVQTDVKSWYEKVKPRVDSDEEAYGAAHGSASDTTERVVVLSEVGDVDATFIERFIAVGTGAMPDDWKKDPELSMVYRDSLYDAIDPYVIRAKEIAFRCDEVSPGDAKCKALSARIDTIVKSGPARTPPPPP